MEPQRVIGIDENASAPASDRWSSPVVRLSLTGAR